MKRTHFPARNLLLLALSAGLGFDAAAQAEAAGTPKGWHTRDRATDGYYGISLDKAYDFLKGRKSQTVVVAVIDSGIDTLHEDLKPVLWRNPKEIAGNGIDDDKNGYVDDIHGWNFLGGKDGRNVKQDSYEGARFYHQYRAKYEGVDSNSVPAAEKALYRDWVRARNNVTSGVDPNQVKLLERMYPMIKRGDSVLAVRLNKKEFTGNDLKAYTPPGTEPMEVNVTRQMYMQIFTANKNFDITNTQILGELEGGIMKAEAITKAPRNYRGEITGDNEADINDRNYGNNDVMAASPSHGTHVSGIIAAVRGNEKGMDGVADNVRIMSLRAVPDGDEHDKDIALAIRYAVDNGAKIINMSFGKSFSPQKQWVDDAVRYAQEKGVILVHAAGNDAKNLDQDYNFPNASFLNEGRATTWLTIGASGDPKNGGLAADFSNWGKNEADLFAPGRDIYSTIPGGNTYGSNSGTSMASPVAAGVAALVWEYFPTLTAPQLKWVLENSVVKLDTKTAKPGDVEEVPFSSLSRTGGIINAYEAVKLADAVTSGKVKVKIEDNKIKVKTEDGKKTKVKTEDNKTKTKTDVKSF
ncbi:S8 family peptidase [Flaviaesturariibacter amylovorans]|uniref:S8 family peptidase n=1 Tax=Flaviaesturariibacter amylovorans TaxID=1084520 RepID=A0ABP8GT24_9BACT